MIHLACKLPIKINVAVSGGSDSMSLLSFCLAGRRNINVIHIDHGTQFSKQAREFVESYCRDHNIPCDTHTYNDYGMPPNEEVWRNFRLEVYRKYTSKGEYVATGHTNDDLVEWYLMCALRGHPKFMKPVDEEHKLLKPFLFTEKAELIAWCARKKVPYLNDPTNTGDGNSRAILRGMMPQFAKIHSGFKTSIKNRAMRSADV